MTIGNSNYHSLQTSLRHRSGPLELLGAYTFSKSIDDSSGWGDQINPLNQRLSRSLSAFDVTHNFVVSYYYELPFGHLFGHHRVSDGWVITSITRFSTGLPIFLRERDDNSLLGTRFTGPNGNGVDTPNYTPGDLQFNDPRTGQPYFNIDLFSKEAIGQLCTAKQSLLPRAWPQQLGYGAIERYTHHRVEAAAVPL